MASRKVVGYSKNWMDQVTPGEPFALVGGGVQMTQPARAKPQMPKRKERDGRVRPLSELGELLTVKECAQILKTTQEFVYEKVGTSKIRCTRVGRYIRIAKKDLEEFLCA